MQPTTREPNTASGPNPEYRELEIVRDPDGVIAIVTERIRDGRVSFSIAREFESDGKTRRGSYISRRHLPAVQRLLVDLEERLELAEDRARSRKRDRETTPSSSGNQP
jgi:hypothetical protein